MAERLVFLFQQVAVCYPCVTNSESGHDSYKVKGDIVLRVVSLTDIVKWSRWEMTGLMN